MAAADPQLRRIYELIGEIAISWSEVELLWYLIFTTLMPQASRAQIDAIFFQWDTSAKQRELVLAVADATYPNDKRGRPHPMRRRIGQLNAATQVAAGDRNAAIHAVINPPQTMAAVLQGLYTVQPGSNPRKRNKLAGKKLEEELTRSAASMNKLSADLRYFLDTISPKLEVRPEMIESLHRLGFQVPNWIAQTPNRPTDPPLK